MDINLIADSSVSSAPAGFASAVEAAAEVFDQDIPGNYTVNITYGWGTFDNASDDIGAAFSIGGPSAGISASYGTLKNLLAANAQTDYQVAAVASLPAQSPYSQQFFVSPAEQKALGIFSGDPNAVDGSVEFSTQDDSGGVLSPYIQEAAYTEIAHALGMESGEEPSYLPQAVDLFRYTAPGVYYTGNGSPSYLSVDGGNTDLANFSTASSNGVSDPTLFTGLSSDPFNLPLSSNTEQSLTSLDLGELQVMGFAGNSNLFGTFTHDATGDAGTIYELYKAILGRAPDPSGLQLFTSLLDGGTSAVSIAQDMLASPEYAADYGTSIQSDSGFITQLYADGLGRAPDAGGLQTYETALASGVSRAQAAVDLATSPEERSDLAPVFSAGVFVPDASDIELAHLYYGLLGRAPDAAGLAGWEIQQSRGLSLSDTATAFLDSSERQSTFGTQDNTQFVASLYESALGRAPDSGGLATYLGALNSGTSRTQVALDITESQEATAHLAPAIQSNFGLA